MGGTFRSHPPRTDLRNGVRQAHFIGEFAGSPPADRTTRLLRVFTGLGNPFRLLFRRNGRWSTRAGDIGKRFFDRRHKIRSFRGAFDLHEPVEGLLPTSSPLSDLIVTELDLLFDLLVVLALKAQENDPGSLCQRDADRYDTGVEHHVRQAAVAVERVVEMKLDDGLLLPVLQPVIPRDPSVVLIGLAVSLCPTAERRGGEPDPREDLRLRDLGFRRPAVDVIDDAVASVVGKPAAIQGSPTGFFSRTCS